MLKMSKAKIFDEVWQLYDTNGDGVLQKKEFYWLIKDLMSEYTSKIGKRTLKRTMKKLDLDWDGTISKDELLSILSIKHSKW